MPLTTEQAALLAAELTDPAYEGTTDAEASDLLNTPVVIPASTTTRHVPLSEMQTLAYRLGVPAKLNAALLVEQTKVLAQTTLDLFASRLASVNIADTAFVAMLDALETATLLTSQERAAVEALAVVNVPESIGPTPFQAIAGLGDAFIALEDGTRSKGTCYPWMVTQARSN